MKAIILKTTSHFTQSHNSLLIWFHFLTTYCRIGALLSIKRELKIMQFKRFMCLLCGYIYDEAKGWPEDGIEPGTRWEDVPLTWQCPECGATKDDFEMVQI